MCDIRLPAEGWELEEKEIVHPDTEEHDIEAIKLRWKDLGAQALECITGHFESHQIEKIPSDEPVYRCVC